MNNPKRTAKRSPTTAAKPAASNAATPTRAVIRTGAIAGWSMGAVLAAVTHVPLLPSIGAGVVAGMAAGAAYPLLARVFAVRASR